MKIGGLSALVIAVFGTLWVCVHFVSTTQRKELAFLSPATPSAPQFTKSYRDEIRGSVLTLGLESESESVATGTSANRLRRSRKSTALSISADVRVKKVTLSKCGENPIEPFARASIGAFFLQPTDPSDHREIFTALAIAQEGARSSTVKAVVLECEQNCFLREEDTRSGKPAKILLEKDVRSIDKNVSTHLTIRNEPNNRRVLFLENGATVAEYVYGDDFMSARGSRHMDVATFVPNCMAGAEAAIVAEFSNVGLE